MPPYPVQEFNRADHVYRCAELARMLADAIRFFNGTPVHSLPPPKPFKGAGVYALYCTAASGLYAKYGREVNQLAYSVPVYIGKAVPKGWRQSRSVGDDGEGDSLAKRLREHAKSIRLGSGLDIGDFSCRFVIFEGQAAHMIAAVEAALIAETNPLWNSVVDGFGNHPPGKGREKGRMSQWDCLHPGRPWARLLPPCDQTQAEVRRRVTDYLAGLR